MRECHSGKADRKIGPSQNFISQPYGSADHKTDMAFSLHAQRFNFISKLYRIQHFAANLQRNYVGVISNQLQDSFPFFLPDHILQSFAGVLRGFLISHFQNL